MMIKFQSGGTFVPPLVSYQPVTVTGNGRASAASAMPAASSSSSSDLTDKDLMKMMEKLEGLPSDMQVLTDSLLNFYINLLYSPLAGTSNIASRYLSALAQMRTANFNNKQFENAFQIVSKNGGINEYAVNEHGQLFCMNSDKDFKLIRPEDLKENSGYLPLTNAELLRLRAYDKSLAFNNSILGVVQNGIGMPAVTEMIMKIVSGLGTNEVSDEGYVSTKQGKLINGIRELNNAITLAQQQGLDFNGTTDDLYSYKIVNRDQKAQIDLAISYIYATLPENAKSLIKTKTKNGSDSEVLQYVLALISSLVDSTLDFTLKLEGGKTAKKAAESKDPTSKTKLNPAAMLQAGYGLKEVFTIQTAQGGSNGISVPTVRMPIVSKEGKAMGVGTLSDVASSGYAGFLDFNNATMGGVNISSEGFLDIAVNGTSLYVGELPIDMEEYSTTGNVRPDIELLGRLKQAQNKIKQENIQDPLKINEVYSEFKLPIMYGPNGDELGNYRKFGILNGTAIQQAFGEGAEFADYLQETTDQNTIKNVLSIIQKGRGEKDRVSFNEKGWFNSIFDSYDHVYKGTIFIPVNEDYFTGAVGFGDFPTPTEAETIEAQQQAMQREELAASNYVNPGML